MSIYVYLCTCINLSICIYIYIFTYFRYELLLFCIQTHKKQRIQIPSHHTRTESVIKIFTVCANSCVKESHVSTKEAYMYIWHNTTQHSLFLDYQQLAPNLVLETPTAATSVVLMTASHVVSTAAQNTTLGVYVWKCMKNKPKRKQANAHAQTRMPTHINIRRQQTYNISRNVMQCWSHSFCVAPSRI